MPIPGSILSGLNFDPATLGDIAYPSLCTFLGITRSNSDGQETHVFAVIDAAHTDIPCRIAPQILIRPQLQEKQAGEFQMQDARLQVNLSKYVGDVDVTMRLTVDGVTYEIVSVEPDGSKLTTRVGVGKIVPFSE